MFLTQEYRLASNAPARRSPGLPVRDSSLVTCFSFSFSFVIPQASPLGVVTCGFLLINLPLILPAWPRAPLPPDGV